MSELNDVAMLRYDAEHQLWRDVEGTGGMARALLGAGAAVDGDPEEPETPLITAASYGDPEVARVLIEHGADLEATARANAGGVPGATALVHAAVFGMTAVVDLLAAAGAQIPDLVIAAAVGEIGDRLEGSTPDDRLLAMVMAADHQRIAVIDRLARAGTPIDEADPIWGRHPLRLAAENGRADSVRRLLELGADPTRTDAEGRTPGQLAQQAGHLEVQEMLST